MADEREVRRVVGILEDFTADLIRQIGTEITAELIERTPVDTGWARANWIPSVTVPVDFEQAVIESREDRVASTPASRSTQDSAIAQLASGYDFGDGSIFISNNVPYITILNGGSSTQAPEGFVQIAIEQGIRNVVTPRQPR